MIKYLVIDVDGTLTDGKIYMGPGGEVMKAFNIKDGCGIHDILLPNHIVPVILTGRTSDIVLSRCQELGIAEIRQGVKDKAAELRTIASDFSSVAYIGDDINDLLTMKVVKDSGGLIGAPQDAVKEVLEIADFVSSYKGGDGAVREFIEWVVKQNQAVSSGMENSRS